MHPDAKAWFTAAALEVAASQPPIWSNVIPLALLSDYERGVLAANLNGSSSPGDRKSARDEAAAQAVLGGRVRFTWPCDDDGDEGCLA